MDQALKPTNLFEDFASLGSSKQATPKEIDKETEAYAFLSKTDGWKYLSEYIDRIIEDLNGSVRILMETGAEEKLIGQRAIVKELVNDVLRRIKSRVDDARESVEG